VNLYKDAEKLIEDFFQNFEMRIAPRTGCDEVAVQRVKETLSLYLEFTTEDGKKLDRSELESIFRAALTDFLYEVYFTLEDPIVPDKLEGDEDTEELWEEESDLDEDGEDGAFYAVLSLAELCGLLREDPEAHSECDCLVDRAIAAAHAEGPRKPIEELEALTADLSTKKPTPAVRKILSDAHLAAGEVHLVAEEPARAIAAFKQAARAHGHLPDAYARIAEAYAKTGDLASAVDAWREQIRLAADDPEPYFASAHALESLGKPERAVEMLHAMLEIDGENASALDMLVRLSHELGQVREAQAFRERLLSLRPPRRIEDIAVWVKHHIEAGNFELILEHLHKEELDTPGQSILNLLKAIVFLAKDDPDNVEVELLLFRDKLNGQSDELDLTLAHLEKIFGSTRILPLRHAVAEHVTTRQS
jgi:tetratricopeptide (TPR) repeat protein